MTEFGTVTGRLYIGVMGLNQRQREVLQWIADGSPERDWPDWTHRSTAKALQSRGLARVRGHGAGWSAAITERGQRVLDGDEDASEGSAKRGSRAPASVRGKTRRPANAEIADPNQSAPLQIDPEDLIADLKAAPDQALRIPDPDPATRAGYLRALATLSADLVPGRKAGHPYRPRPRRSRDPPGRPTRSSGPRPSSQRANRPRSR